jgi:AbrB family looped-hinge helix DNA binding protein
MSKPLETIFKARVSSKGQLVIPKHIREALNLNEGDELLLVPTKDGIFLKQPLNEVGRLRGFLKGLNVDIEECEALLSEARRSLVKVIEQ